MIYASLSCSARRVQLIILRLWRAEIPVSFSLSPFPAAPHFYFIFFFYFHFTLSYTLSIPSVYAQYSAQYIHARYYRNRAAESLQGFTMPEIISTCQTTFDWNGLPFSLLMNDIVYCWRMKNFQVCSVSLGNWPKLLVNERFIHGAYVGGWHENSRMKCLCLMRPQTEGKRRDNTGVQ